MQLLYLKMLSESQLCIFDLSFCFCYWASFYVSNALLKKENTRVLKVQLVLEVTPI